MLLFENVETCGWCSDKSIVTFGTLKDMGLLTKDYRLEPWDHDGDSATIVWTVVGDVVFSDQWGSWYVQGDVIEWPK